MSHFTSFISENTPIPDPPHLKYIGLVISCIFTFFFFFISLFVMFEFSMDIFGTPLQFEPKHEEIVLKEYPDILDTEPEDMSPQGIMSRFNVLSPLPESCISSNGITVLCTWNSPKGNFRTLPFSTMVFKVDGISFPWDERYGNNTWLAHLTLDPGKHRIQSPVFDTEIFIEDSEHPAPAAWKRFTMHISVDDPQECASCHYMLDESNVIVRKGHNLGIGDWKGNESCLTCHQDEQYEKTHLNLAAPETDCCACHVVHGTVNSEKLLKYPKDDFQ